MLTEYLLNQTKKWIPTFCLYTGQQCLFYFSSHFTILLIKRKYRNLRPSNYTNEFFVLIIYTPVHKLFFSAYYYICTYSPPKSCIPSKAKMRMKRKRRNNRLTMDLILLSRETTRLRSEDQYL